MYILDKNWEIAIPGGLNRPQRPNRIRSNVHVSIQQLDNTRDYVLYVGICLPAWGGSLENGRRGVLAIDPRDLLASSSLLIYRLQILCLLVRHSSQLMGLRQEFCFLRSPLSFPRHGLARCWGYTVENVSFTYLVLWKILNAFPFFFAEREEENWIPTYW